MVLDFHLALSRVGKKIGELVPTLHALDDTRKGFQDVLRVRFRRQIDLKVVI